MPCVQAPAKILVTGGSGFVGSWVIRRLLDNQYDVRATVRSSSKGETMCKLFHDCAERFEYAVIPDIEKEGAFDDVLEGVRAVHHIASPLTGDPDQLINAAVNGTLSMLKSVAKRGLGVQRVVLTSSAGALMEPKSYPCEYTETDWNNNAIKVVEQGDASPLHKYYASKTLAEKVAWEFVKDKDFDLVTVLPTLVIGPVIHQVESKDKLSYSLAHFYDGMRCEKAPSSIFGNWVDVRDVAESHLLAMEQEEASGQRLITSAGPASWQLIYDAINETSPKLSKIPQGQPGNVDEGRPGYVFRTEKIRELGLQYMTLAQSARDAVVSMREHGW